MPHLFGTPNPSLTPKYKTGHIADPHGHRVTSFRLLAAANSARLGGGPIPRLFDYAEFVTGNGGPGILDQGGSSSCTGQGTEGAICTTLAARGTPTALGSPIGSYTLSRVIDRVQDLDGSLPPLRDIGAYPNANLRARTEWGVPSRKDWGGYLIDANGNPLTPDLDHINDEPTVRQLELASAYKMTGYYRIDSEGEQLVYDVLAALQLGIMTALACEVDPAFESYDGNGVIGAPDPNRILGGHDVYLCGARWDGNDTDSLEVKIANSWSTSWGADGFAWCNRAWLAGTVDRYVMMVHRV